MHSLLAPLVVHSAPSTNRENTADRKTSTQEGRKGKRWVGTTLKGYQLLRKAFAGTTPTHHLIIALHSNSAKNEDS